MESSHGVPPPAVSPRTGLMHASSLGSLGTMVSQSPCYASPVPLGIYFPCYLPFPLKIFFSCHG